MFRANGMGPRDGGQYLSSIPSISSLPSILLILLFAVWWGVSVWDVAFLCGVYECGARYIVDSLGGDYYWTAGLSLISDLPPKPHWPLKAHFFLNAGQLQGSQPGTSTFFPS